MWYVIGPNGGLIEAEEPTVQAEPVQEDVNEPVELPVLSAIVPTVVAPALSISAKE